MHRFPKVSLVHSDSCSVIVLMSGISCRFWCSSRLWSAILYFQTAARKRVSAVSINLICPFINAQHTDSYKYAHVVITLRNFYKIFVVMFL